MSTLKNTVSSHVKEVANKISFLLTCYRLLLFFLIIIIFFCFTVSQDSKTLKVDEETEHTMRVTWKPAPGKVVNYRVVYRPQGGGRQMVAKVPPTVTSTVLKRLQPQTTYDITVLPMYKTGEGKLRQGSGTTGIQQ